MEICRTVNELTNTIEQVKQQHKTIGIVPTMGALHEGHISLFKRARAENDIFVSSIFVNPVQFNSNEDFEKYPKSEDEDLAILEQNGCDIAFVPTAEEVYRGETPEHWSFGSLEVVLEGK